MKRIWGRIGMDIILSDKEYELLCDEKMPSEVVSSFVLRAITTGKAYMNGETYFPEQNMLSDNHYDNSDKEVMFHCSVNDNDIDYLSYPFLLRPYNRTEIIRNCTPEMRISGIISISLSEIVFKNPEDILDLISEKLVGSVMLSDISFSIIGHNGDNLLLFVSAVCDDSSITYDPNYDEFDDVFLPEQFDFISRNNSFGIVYHASAEGLDYIVKWGTTETRYTKTEMIRSIRNKEFALCKSQ